MLPAQWADDRKILTEIYAADWGRLSRRAGPIRNQQMLDKGRLDLVVAFQAAKAQPA